MQNEMKTNQVVYGILKVQIEFGVYRYGDRLPTIEESSDLLMVAHKSVSLAYRQLKKEGYISLSARVGATVRAKYSDQEIDQHIQTFFAARKDALLDLIGSMRLFFDNDIQLASWICIPEERLDEMERVAAQNIDPSYRVIKHHQLVYGSLKNDLLMHLIWKICMFFLTPLLSAGDYRVYLNTKTHYLARKIALRRQKNWPALCAAEKDYQDLFYSAVRFFYETRATMPPSEQQLPFTWSSYKNVTQVCYSLGLEIIVGISHGDYPAGAFLPSLDKFAKEKQVSISTVRRTLAILGDLGIVKSLNGIGTQVLPIDQIVENCDISKPTVRNRFVRHLQSLQLFSLTCREVAKATIPAMDAAAIAEWKEQLNAFQNRGRLAIPTAVSLNFLARYAPYQALKTIYSELFKQFIWGFPLICIIGGDREAVSAFYRPYRDGMVMCLEQVDAAGFAAKLEELLRREVEYVAKRLIAFGFQEADDIFIPNHNYFSAQ